MSSESNLVREIVVDGITYKTSYSESKGYFIYDHRKFDRYLCILLRNSENRKRYELFYVDGTIAENSSSIYFPYFNEDPAISFQDSLYWDDIVPKDDHLELISKNITYIVRPENLRWFSEVRSNFPDVLSYRILEKTKLEVQGQIHDLKFPIVKVVGYSDIGYIIQTDETLDYQNIYRFDTSGNISWRIPIPPLSRTECEKMNELSSSERTVYTGWTDPSCSNTHVELSTWSRYVTYEFNIETGILEFVIVKLRWHDERKPISQQQWLKILANPDI